MTEPDISRWATWSEIHAQPQIWRDWGAAFDPAPLRDWVRDFDEVWFCGAGTSAFIGDILVAGLEGQRSRRYRSVPSTDLVARPNAYLTGRRPLVVSFGRSGNSSETVGTLEALAALAPDAPQLNITCNADSALARDCFIEALTGEQPAIVEIVQSDGMVYGTADVVLLGDNTAVLTGSGGGDVGGHMEFPPARHQLQAVDAIPRT